MKRKSIILLFLSAILFFFFGFTSSIKDGKDKLNKNTDIESGVDAHYLYVNNVAMPMNSRGVIADVKIGDNLAQGRLGGKNFLYSAGFLLSGYNDQGLAWSNGVATASRIEDYLPGNFVGDENSKGLFVVKSSDPPFGDSWTNWSNAVDNGAYFYDGDGDGSYNPVDLNGDGIWNEDEDKPDILGDETVWCIFSDTKEAGDRDFSDQDPQGIEIRQTVWAYATSGDLGNIIFLRYSLLNTGAVSEMHDSVYLGIWADPDLGHFKDDLVGSDTTLNAGYVYNDGADDEFGIDPPCFLIDFFQGPWVTTGNPEDEAYNTKGLALGIDTLKGAKNLKLSSFTHYQQGATNQKDPENAEQARFYLTGRNQKGENIDPCTWSLGTVYGNDITCLDVNPKFFYSGDPVSQYGWINNGPEDQRQMSNVGPFKLEAGKPVDVVVAYVVGRGKSALASVKAAKKIDRAAQFVFQNNFNFPAPPPQVEPIVKTDENAIELVWETKPQFDWNPIGNGFNMKFQGYEVYMYNKNSTEAFEGGSENAKLIARYDLNDDIKTVLFEDDVTNERSTIYENGIQLDSATYVNSDDGRIKLRITIDPFTNGKLIKGKPYFFSIVGIGLNTDEIVKFDAIGTYLIPGTAAVGSIKNIAKIIKDENGNVGIVPGDNANTPYYSGIKAEHEEGISEVDVTYSVVDKSLTSTNKYEVDFFLDSLSAIYSLYYKVVNTGSGTVLLDSSKTYNFENVSDLVDGVTVNVGWVVPEIQNQTAEGMDWAATTDTLRYTGAYYVGNDVENLEKVNPISIKNSKASKVSNLRRVEIRFGETSKAFRYVKNPIRYTWTGKDNKDEGFVDVPFAAYVKDESGEERRLAVGFTESAFVDDTLANADGIYNPGTNVKETHEMIVVFNGTYSTKIEDNLAYSGMNNNRPADLGNGYTLRKSVVGATPEVIKIAKSPWFDAMYVVGFETVSEMESFNPSGTYVIEPSKFLTDNDKYSYTIKLNKDASEEAAQFEKVTVYPNPLFAYNPGVSYTGGRADEPYVTFGNLPNDVEIKIFTLSGVLVKTLNKSNAATILPWDLENEDGLRVASGMYLAILSNPTLGDKVLKFGIIMPQKQIKNY